MIDISQEAKQNVINLGDDDDPDAIFAMLKHFYNMNYANQSIGPSGEAGELQFRLKVYQTADFYDAPDLRAQAATRFYSCMSNSIARPARSDDIPEYVVLMIQEVLGPNAPVFPDDRLQDDIFHIVKTNTTKLHQNKLFLKLLAKGEMFNDQYGEMFAQQVGELLASATTRSSPARSVFSVSRGLTSQVPRI